MCECEDRPRNVFSDRKCVEYHSPLSASGTSLYLERVRGV